MDLRQFSQTVQSANAALERLASVRAPADRAMAHAVGVHMRIAAESAGAACLLESGFQSRGKPSSTGAVPSDRLVMEAARCIVGLRDMQLMCGITCELFDNPVTAADGQTYEKDEIEKYWSQGVFRSPLTNSLLPDHSLRPAITVRQTIEKLLSAEIESGKAAALAAGDLDHDVSKALAIEKLLLQIKPQDVHVPGDTFLLKLHGLCENEHLRDFAAACGALNVAAAWSSRTQSPAATPFLVRMLAFSHANQEKLAFLSHEAMIALRSTDSEIQTEGFRVLTALVADRVLQGLEDQMFEVLSPVIVNRTPLLGAPAHLYKSALSFMVHLLMHKQGLVTQRLVAAGAPAVALHVLKTMPDDTVGTNLACCFFSLLGNLPDDTKKRLKEMPGLTKAIMDAAGIRDCGNFALMALAVVIGPRCTTMPAVQFMARFPKYASRHPAALTLLVDATRTPSIDTQVFGERPSVVDIVDYICVHLLTILPCVRCCCKNADAKGLENGVQLLQNICSVFENQSNTRLLSPRSKKLFLAPRSWKSIFVLATEIVNVTPSIDIDDATRVPWQGTCASTLTLIHRYLRLTTREGLANIMTTTDVHQQEIVGACLDILSYGAIAAPAENPVQRCVVLDMMQNAICVIECVCCGVEYDDLGHTDICGRLIEVSFMFSEDTLAGKALGTLQTLVCSAHAPAQFWELRAISSANSGFRQEIVDARGHFYLLEILTNDELVKSRAVEIQVLTLLRDVFSAPSTADNHVDDRFHELCISMTLRKIDTNIRAGVGCCDATLTICLETLANTLIVDRNTPKEGLDALKPWRVILRHGKVMDAMMEVLAHLSVQLSRPSHVIEQALRVIVMLVARGFSLNAATGLPLLYEPRVAERLTTVANFKIFASLLQVVDCPLPETECDDLWCRCEPRAYSVEAYCRQLVCAIALLVLQNEVDESHASVFVDSSIVGAMLALLQPGLEKDPRNDARYITPSGENFIIHALQALVSFFPAFLNAEIAIVLGRVILKDRSCTGLARSDDDYNTGAKRGRNSMTATTDAKKKQKS